MVSDVVDVRGGTGVFGRRLVLAVDAKGYGGADAVTQHQFQEAIARLVDQAAGAAGLDREHWKTQEAGDSLVAFLPDGAYEPALVDTFMRTLDTGLRAFNHGRRWDARLRLRAAVDYGPASPGAIGYVGTAPVGTGRILDSAALRTALEKAPGACLAVGLSETVFRDVVQQGYTTFRADEFRSAWVHEKGYDREAWIWVPGADVRPPAPDADVRPPAPAADPPQPPPHNVFHQQIENGGTGIQSPGANVTINHHHTLASPPPEQRPGTAQEAGHDR